MLIIKDDQDGTEVALLESIRGMAITYARSAADAIRGNHPWETEVQQAMQIASGSDNPSEVRHLIADIVRCAINGW